MADEQEKQGAGIYESASDIEKSRAGFVRRWLEEIELAGKEEENWRKVAKEARDVYEAANEAVTGTAFNIYYSNIETLRPALYNSTPIPDVRRRYGDRDPQAKEGADAIERCLSYSIDEYDFDGAIRETVDDLSITGRGVARVTLQEEIIHTGMLDEQTGAPIEDVGAQTVGCETVSWASFRRGPARTWAKVPWVAFAEYMTRDQLNKLSPVHGPKVPLDMIISGDGTASEGAGGDNPESEVFKRALVWQVWDRAKRQVLHIAPSYSIDVLAATPDPLGLRDFFPIPCPMMTGKTSGRLVPLSPYKIYKPILYEIDTIAKRITKLIKQLRPRGLGPQGVDMDAWAKAEDGEIVEVTQVMQFLESGGMEKLVAWFPMEPTVRAIEQLSLRFAQLKQDLFEVSGLADIMRGQSNPLETKGAQDIKQRWGSLRLQKAQAEVQRFIRDIFRLKAEIIAEKFTPENIAAMTGMEMSAPAITMIKDDKMRGYRIDVETDSTIRGDLTRNQEAMAQFVQGTAQYFSAVAPIVQAEGMSKQAAVAIYSSFARNFKLGKEVDAILDSLADEAAKADLAAKQQGPTPEPEVEKAKVQIAAKQQEAEISKQRGDMELQHMQQKNGMELQHMDAKMRMEQRGREQDLAFRKQEADQKLVTGGMAGEQQLQLKREQSQLALVAKMAGKSKKGINPEADKEEAELLAAGLDKFAQAMTALMQTQAKGQQDIAKLIAQGNANLLRAVTAPKVVTTPDGRKYTSQTATVN